MRSIILFGLQAWFLFLISCNKDSAAVNNTKAGIVGKWNILNDSIFVGVGLNNHLVSYPGQTGDYFDCRRDGHIYMKEGTISDTLSYTLTSDTTILISSFGATINGLPEISHIANLTAHSVTITAPVLITPGGQFGRSISLFK